MPRPESAAARAALRRGKTKFRRGVIGHTIMLHYSHNTATCRGEVDEEKQVNASGTLTIRLRCTRCGLVPIHGTDG